MLTRSSRGSRKLTQIKTKVSCWHNPDMPTLLLSVRYRVRSGKHLLAASISAFDPTRISLSCTGVGDSRSELLATTVVIGPCIVETSDSVLGLS